MLGYDQNTLPGGMQHFGNGPRGRRATAGHLPAVIGSHEQFTCYLAAAGAAGSRKRRGGNSPEKTVAHEKSRLSFGSTADISQVVRLYNQWYSELNCHVNDERIVVWMFHASCGNDWRPLTDRDVAGDGASRNTKIGGCQIRSSSWR
jgi:hypothetical protein